MNELKITVVGAINDVMQEVFSEIGVNLINEVNSGRLGNFRTLTYILPIADVDVIRVRKSLMDKASEKGLAALYIHGDWMRLFVFSKKAFA